MLLETESFRPRAKRTGYSRQTMCLFIEIPPPQVIRKGMYKHWSDAHTNIHTHLVTPNHFEVESMIEW